MPNKQPSTEYTGVYTAIFPNKTPREIELEARVNELEENIKTIFSALIIANHKDIGVIQDTIWVNTYTTLWDYIRIVLNMNDEQFEEFEKQALQKIKEEKTNRCENCKHHYTDYDCLHDYCNINDKEISINDSCEK